MSLSSPCDDLVIAARRGDVACVKDIVENNPVINLSHKMNDVCALHAACRQGHHVVVSYLLSIKNIDVNQKTTGGWTPFMYCCVYGDLECARRLIRDPRVDLNCPSTSGRTPLTEASCRGRTTLIKKWIISGRELDLGDESNPKTDAIRRAKMWGKNKIAALLEKYRQRRVETIYVLRRKCGYYDRLAANVFAVVVFLSDGLLKMRDEEVRTPATRFLEIANRLPMELQMVLSYTAAGCPGDIMSALLTENAFLKLARKLQ